MKRLNLEVSIMNGTMVNDTLTNGLVTISLVYLNYPLTIYGKDFGIYLVFFTSK